MKNQNDMIISIVAVVLALIVAGVLLATQPEPAAQVPVSPVTTTDVALPAGSVTMANSLPNAGQGFSGASGGAGGGGGAPTRGLAPDDSGTSVGKKGPNSPYLSVGS